MPRIAHAVSEFGGSAPDLPPNRFCFEEIAKRMFGMVLLEAPRAFGGAGEIAGIDLVEYGIGGRRQVEFRAAERTG
jgi:hypothetical protein